LLGAKLKPLHTRLVQLMEKHGLASQDVARRIRMLNVGKRTVTAHSFEVVAAATMARKRLRISHFSRQNGKTTEREVSPQRLVHYRDNWYLDAWCHLRDELRSFSVDVVSSLEVLSTPAKEVTQKQLAEAFDSGYGIFGGATKAVAIIKFTAERARWVAGEAWHPNQRSTTQADGSYVLEIPYSDERELIGDLLRFGADVEVMAPPDLRNKVKRALHEAAGRYV